MKKNLLRVAVALCLTFHLSSLMAQQVVHDDWKQMQIEFNTGTIHIDTVIADGQQWAKLSFDGSMPVGEVGDPMLPAYSTMVEVPLCKGFEMAVVEAEYETFDIGLPLLPMQPSRSKSDTSHHPLIVNAKAYQSPNTHGIGGENVIEAIGIARDRRLARLQYSPIVYVPATGKVTVCRKATVTVNYVGADREGTLAMFERYYSPAFNSGLATLNSLYPKSVRTTAPIRYLIVAHSQFRGQMDNFVQWKRRKGYITDIAYTDDPGVGTTASAIQAYIQGQYSNATTDNPAPTYLLLVGDVAQLPPFDAAVSSPSSDHVTDLYFTTWTTGDHLPDCYYGRFSAQNISQLSPQVDKTLMYEQYTFADPSFLDRAVMVAGVDGGSAGDYGYSHADPAMDYAITNYVNGSHGWSQVMYFKNNTSIVPAGTNVTVGSSSSSNSSTVRSYYNQGAGFINYSAHGGSTGWGTPSFDNDHVNQMTNTQKFGLMIGNCCLTNKFEVSTCFGEALLRKGNYAGAVGYIGGSNSTYWGQDFYWAVGVRSSISATMSMAYNSANLGVYDRVFHTHGEAYSEWCITQGSIMMQGNMAVESSTSGSDMKHYYWEIYHLMGDPSVMPYMTQADTMVLTVQPTLVYGTTTLTVGAAPYAYVALTDTLTHSLKAAAYADASGQATLTLPSALPVGAYELAASAQQYRTAFRTISIVHPAGPFPIVSSISPSSLVAGDTATLAVTIENPGNATAHNIVTHLATSNPALTLLNDSITVDSLEAGETLIVNVQAIVSPTAVDGINVLVNTETDWTGATLDAISNIRITIVAPRLLVTILPDNISMQPNETQQVDIILSNAGHAEIPAGRLALTSPTMMLQTGNAQTLPAIQPGDTVAAQFTLHTSQNIPEEITLPLTLELVGPFSYSDILPVYIGQDWCETFENGFHFNGWTNGGNLPWTVSDSGAWQGSWCARSAQGLNHSQNSELNLTVTASVADSVSFYYAVSSESGYDKFHFFIDTAELITASGEVEWTRAVFPLTAGQHTLSFTYTKDYSVNRGSDCAWIDMLMLPHNSRPVSCSSTDLCQGQSVTSHGDTVPTDQPASFSLVFENNNTVVIEDYTVHPATYTIDTVEACDSYVWNGTEYTASCNTVSSFSDVNGCDSTYGLKLTIYHSYSETIEVNGCDSAIWNDVLYTSSANLSSSLTTVHGCDSSTTVKIRIHPSVATVDSLTTDVSPYEWNNEQYTESGVYTVVLSSIYGCDSTVTLVLTIDSTYEGIENIDNQSPIIEVWPNPTTDVINFSREVEECQVYDAAGRLMMSEQNKTKKLNISHLPHGVYLLRIVTSDTTLQLRIILTK